jgi:VanZ family protein
VDARRIRTILWAVGPVVLYMGLIVFLSAQSHLPNYRVPDKVAHTTEYAVLGALITRALLVLGRAPVRSTMLIAVVLSVAFGASDEIHQMFVPYRDASLLDLAADAVGSTLGAALFLWLDAQLRRRKRA